MASQLFLVGAEYFNEPEPEKVEVNTRVRYEVPTYIKFYSIYQYDREKFTKLLKIWLETDEGKNRTLETLKAKQNEILELCYVKDAEGNLLRDSDENHIFRYPTLAKIYRLIYNQIGANPFDNYYEQDGLRVIRDIYTEEDYEYQGKTYKGQKFVNVSASIDEGSTLSFSMSLRILSIITEDLPDPAPATQTILSLSLLIASNCSLLNFISSPASFLHIFH